MNKKTIEEYIKYEKLDLDKIVDDYTPYVRTIINNMVNNNLTLEDKEEVLLDVFFILWKKYNEEKNIYSLDSYIAGITRNLVKEQLKKLNCTVSINDNENILDFSSYDLYVNEREDVERLKDSINNLKSIDVKIINLYYYSSKSIKDIAKELNISEMNVKTRLHRIRKKIKKELVKGEF